jgi:uncharacterized protein (TIGR02145 family)
MRKILLSMMLCMPMVLGAQGNGVAISGLSINADTVTFNVGWNKNNMPALWSDSVWVFVDYNNNGRMTRLPVTAATVSAGTVIKVDGNDKGAWVIGNARTNGSFSATVQLLTATADIAGACAYASNYPPVGEYISDAEISFTGTPMYDITLRHGNGSTVTVRAGNTFLVPCDYTLTSFTDATAGAPGTVNCIPMGEIDFTVPAVSKNMQASFVVSREPVAPSPASITYHWSAPDFSPATHEGRTFTATAPATLGTYSIKLTAQSEGYCPFTITKNNVVVSDCHAPGATGVTFAEFNPCTVTSYGATYTLTDNRDRKTYKVKYMPDGRYWMAQDLTFGTCTASSWKNDNSEGATTVTPTVAPGYVGHCRANTVSGAGYYYNWPATMNNTKAYYGSTNSSFECTGTGSGTSGQNPGACKGICPEGWHIPTGNTNGEFYTLHNALVSYSKCSNQNCWLSPAMPEIVKEGGGYLFPEGDVCCSNGYMYYTSTSANATQVYHAHLCAAFTAGNDFYNVDKRWGMRIRCVRNY